jgi:hypothetical protein
MCSKPTPVDLDKLYSAFDFANGDPLNGVSSYVSRSTGETHLVAPDHDLPPPDDLDTSDDYLCLPDRRDLNLGRNMVFDFVQETMPDEWETVRAIFSRRGAYARFKDLLGYRNMTEAWHRYEETRTYVALRTWCQAEGLEVAISNPRTAKILQDADQASKN